MHILEYIPNISSPLVRSNSSSYSYAEILSRIEKRTKSLEMLKVHKTSIFSKNSIDEIILILSLLSLDKTIVLHNTRLNYQNWLQQKKLSNTFVAFSDNSCDLNKLGFNKVFSHKDSELVYKSEIDSDEVSSKELEAKKEDIIIFTSGSTGLGKGVRLSLENFFTNAKASNKVNKLEQGDCWLASLPFYHVGGLCIVFRCLEAGASFFLLDKFSASNIYNALKDNPEITHVSLVPSVLKELLENKDAISLLKKLKLILIGGAPTEKRVLERIIELKLPVRTSYGMSETCSHVTFLREALNQENSSTVGQALDSAELKLSEYGELLVKSKSLFLGYLGRENTPEWFHTGDLASIDSSGRFKIIGRADRTIISGGENINPKEIEDLALEVKGVEKSAVISKEDSRWGQVPILFMEVEQGFKIEELNNIFLLKLAKYKIPKEIKIIKKIPLTGIGKIDYKLLESSYPIL